MIIALSRLVVARQRHWMRQAKSRLRRGDGAGAFRYTARAAQRGNHLAQFSLGLNYLSGIDTPPSPETAVLWLERAARGGHADAMATLAKLALRGIDPAKLSPKLFGSTQTSDPRYDQGLLWARRAASGGSTEGMIVLAALLSDGPEDFRDRDAARSLLEQAVASGSAPAGLSLALMLGRMPLPDACRISRLLMMAATAGAPAAIYLWGVTKEFAFGCPQDIPAAVGLYRRAAELGVQPAQRRLGCALLNGIGTPRDLVAGETWLRKAAMTGDAKAATRLSDFHARDERPNFVEAGAWLMRAAELGDAAAARIVGFLHLTGTGLHEDRDEAARWFKLAQQLATPKASDDVAALLVGQDCESVGPIDIRGWFKLQAALGDSTAAYRLAVCFAIGLGGTRDDHCAVEWLLKASPGVAAAQLLLGQMLLEGRGITRDETIARGWIERAAATGSIYARVALAELLASGRGGDPNPAAALSLFLEAARNGHLGALYAVGAMYNGGHGIVRDDGLAREWLLRAAEAGHPTAKAMVFQMGGGMSGSAGVLTET